jgi:hypothetical protein
MPNFYYRDFFQENKPKRLELPSGSTPNDFKKLIGIDDKKRPTICFRKHKNSEPEFLSRKRFDAVAEVYFSEWDEPIPDGYDCYFTTYPNADGGFTTALVVSLIVSVVVGVGTYLLTPRPNLGLNQHDQDVSPTYDLTQQGNRVRLNQPKPIHYGTIRAYPDIWSNSWTESVNNKRIYHALLNMGYNYIEIDDYRIDDTDLTTFPWVDLNVRYPGDAPTSRFPKPVVTSREVKNIDVEDSFSEYYTLNDPNPISKSRYIYLDFVNDRGFYYSGGIDDRGTADRATMSNINLASLPATIDGAVVTDFLALNQTDSFDNGWWTHTGAGNPATRHVNMNTVNEFINGSVYVSNGTYAGQRFRQTVRILAMSDPKIFVDYNTSKEINETVVWIKIRIQEIDSVGANVGSPLDVYHKIQGASNEPFYTTFDYDLGSEKRVKVEVIQGYYYTTDSPFTEHFVNETSYKELSSVMNKTIWIGLRGDLNFSEYIAPDNTLIEIQVQASGKLNDSNIGIFNFLGGVRLPVYDFGTNTWSTIRTNSPIWAFYDIITNPKYGMGLNRDDDADLISDYVDIGNLEEIFDSIDPLGSECNARFDTSMSANEMLAQIAQSMRCVVYNRGGKYLLARDEIKTSINGFFSRENIKEGSLSIELVPKNDFSPTWMRVTYFDSVTSKKETVDCVLPSALSQSAQYQEPFEEVELRTITDRTKAWQEGIFLLAQQKYRNEIIRFSTDAEGFFPSPMDFISVTHPMLTSSQSGYIQKVDGAIIYLSEPIIFNGYETGLISFKNLDGTCTPYYICRPCVNQYCVELIEFDTATDNYTAFPFLSQEDQPLTEETTFTFGVTEQAMICVVKKITAEGTNGANIEAVNHEPMVHMFDKAIHLMPELGEQYTVWDEYIVDVIDCKVNLATKTVTVRWTGSGFNSYNIRYLFNNLGVEQTTANNVVQGAPGTHTDTLVYTGEPPSRVLVVPVIDVTISPSVTEELEFMAKVCPIETI